MQLPMYTSFHCALILICLPPVSVLTSCTAHLLQCDWTLWSFTSIAPLPQTFTTSWAAWAASAAFRVHCESNLPVERPGGPAVSVTPGAFFFSLFDHQRPETQTLRVTCSDPQPSSSSSSSEQMKGLWALQDLSIQSVWLHSSLQVTLGRPTWAPAAAAAAPPSSCLLLLASTSNSIENRHNENIQNEASELWRSHKKRANDGFNFLLHRNPCIWMRQQVGDFNTFKQCWCPVKWMVLLIWNTSINQSTINPLLTSSFYFLSFCANLLQHAAVSY